MNIENVFVSYGAGTDKNCSAWKFYKYMNNNVQHKLGKYGCYKNKYALGGDVIFNFQGKLNNSFRLNESASNLTLHCLSMCYTNLNKSIMQSKGVGRNLNTIKGGMIDGFDRGDRFISLVDEYYNSSSTQTSQLEKIINKDAKKFLDEFKVIDTFVFEVYSINRDYNCLELKEAIKTYFYNYSKYIRHKNDCYENSKINSYIKNDLEKSCNEIELRLNFFVDTKCQGTKFDIISCLKTLGQSDLQGTNIDEYYLLAVLFWVVRLDSVIRK